MNIEEQQALLKIYQDGYVVHWTRGMYLSQASAGKIFEVTQEWIDEDSKYGSRVRWQVGDIAYKDDTYTGFPLESVSIHDFKIYKKIDVEKLIAKYLPKTGS